MPTEKNLPGPWVRLRASFELHSHARCSALMTAPASLSAGLRVHAWDHIQLWRVAQEAYRLQLRCFLGLVHEQRHLPMLKELLQLYTAVSLRKLASLMDLDEATVRGQLMLLKARPRCFLSALALCLIPGIL